VTFDSSRATNTLTGPLLRRDAEQVSQRLSTVREAIKGTAYVLPDHPVRIERHRAISRIQATGLNILGRDIHAYSQRSLLHNPLDYRSHQPVGDSLPSVFFRYVDSLQFAVATKTLRAMARDETNHSVTIVRNKRHTFLQRLLWGMLTLR
jgi:hypothetical protein